MVYIENYRSKKQESQSGRDVNWLAIATVLYSALCSYGSSFAYSIYVWRSRRRLLKKCICLEILILVRVPWHDIVYCKETVSRLLMTESNVISFCAEIYSIKMIASC